MIVDFYLIDKMHSGNVFLDQEKLLQKPYCHTLKGCAFNIHVTVYVVLLINIMTRGKSPNNRSTRLSPFRHWGHRRAQGAKIPPSPF